MNRVDSAQGSLLHRSGTFADCCGTSDATKVLTPSATLQMMLTKMERAHDAENSDEPFAPPSLAELARIPNGSGIQNAAGKRQVVARAGAAGDGGAV